jgi:hypothetical protein
MHRRSTLSRGIAQSTTGRSRRGLLRVACLVVRLHTASTGWRAVVVKRDAHGNFTHNDGG